MLAGNSIGGFTALAVAAKHPHLVGGVASLNGAGKFMPPPDELAAFEAAAADKAARETPLSRAAARAAAALTAAVSRLVIAGAFVVTKQPARIGQVLRQVYPRAPDRADAALVASIEFPARDADAPEVFYRIVSRNNEAGPPSPEVAVDTLLGQLRAPLLLCWGESDPWIVSATADRIEALCRELGVNATRVSIDAGHCPQDENPAQVNAALAEFLAGVSFGGPRAE